MRNEEFGAGQPSDELSGHDKEILDFARDAPTGLGRRAYGIREKFDMTETSYLQKLNRLLDHPKSMEYDAQTVNRYRRIRSEGMKSASQRAEERATRFSRDAQ